MHITTKIQPGILRKPNGYVAPSVLIVQDFTEDTLVGFSQALNCANNSPQPIIPVMVDSFGGSIFALLGLLDAIQGNEKPILTYTMTQAMSCGAVLLAAGTKGHRYASPNSTILIHEAASSFEGKKSDVLNEAAQMDSMNDKLLGVLARHSNKPKSFYKSMLKKGGNTDIYIGAKDAKNFGLVDFVGIPELEMEVSAKYTIRCK